MVNKKDQIQIDGITRKDGELAIEFVNFLEYHETQTMNNIYLSLWTWCFERKYSPYKMETMYNLVHMYVHKILRHQPKKEEG